MADYDVTLGELHRKIVEHNDNTSKNFGQIYAKLDALPTRLELDLKLQPQEDRIASLESFKDWAVRLTLGLVVSGVFVAVFALKGV